MPQEQLYEQVARRTGEDRRTIARLGFSPLRPMPIELQTDEPRKPLVVDWDELELERYLAMCG
jgi:hypothetical protein